jgi:hypothetical protein
MRFTSDKHPHPKKERKKERSAQTGFFFFFSSLNSAWQQRDEKHTRAPI